MSRSYQKICFNLDADMIDSILRFVVLPEGCDFSYFVKCMFINRCIDKGYLDEFGAPVVLPTLDCNVDLITGVDYSSLYGEERTISADFKKE